MSDSKKQYKPQEVAAAIAKTLKEKLTKHEESKKPKSFSPLQAVSEVTKVLKEKIEQHKELKKNSPATQAEDNASNPVSSPAKSTELTQGKLTGCEPTHADAVEHHAFFAAARFHEGNEKLAQDHLLLAKAHALASDIDPQPMIDFAYDLTSEMDAKISSIFGNTVVVHPADNDLVKSMKKKVEKCGPPRMGKKEPSSEEVDIASGKGVDKVHVGPTPDDRKCKELGDDHAQNAVVKDEDMDKASSEAQDYISGKVSKLRHEGYPQEQAIAIAHEYARKKGYQVSKKSEDEYTKRNLKKDYLSPDIKQLKQAKGYPLKAKKSEEADLEDKLDGHGNKSKCNSTMNKKKD